MRIPKIVLPVTAGFMPVWDKKDPDSDTREWFLFDFKGTLVRNLTGYVRYQTREEVEQAAEEMNDEY